MAVPGSEGQRIMGQIHGDMGKEWGHPLVNIQKLLNIVFDGGFVHKKCDFP